MNTVQTLLRNTTQILSKGADLPLLFLRLMLAYTFYDPALKKLSDIESTAQWFASINIPFPTLNAYLSSTTELLGAILLTLGLGTRFISIPLIITMLVAIITVHWQYGFNMMTELKETAFLFRDGTYIQDINNVLAGGVGGYELPVYYILMLLILVTKGSGRLSVDYFIAKKYS